MHKCPYCGGPASADHITGTVVMCNECGGWYLVWHQVGKTLILPAQEPAILPADYDDRRWYEALWAVLQRECQVCWHTRNLTVRCSRDAAVGEDVIGVTVSIRGVGVHAHFAVKADDGVEGFIARLHNALKHFEV